MKRKDFKERVGMLKKILAKIKTLRIEKGLSQNDIAFSLNVNRTTYARKEKGLVPLTLEEFLKIANTLRVHPSTLLIKI